MSCTAQVYKVPFCPLGFLVARPSLGQGCRAIHCLARACLSRHSCRYMPHATWPLGGRCPVSPQFPVERTDTREDPIPVYICLGSWSVASEQEKHKPRGFLGVFCALCVSVLSVSEKSKRLSNSSTVLISVVKRCRLGFQFWPGQGKTVQDRTIFNGQDPPPPCFCTTAHQSEK